MSTEEGWHTLDDGEKLYTKTWKSDGPVKAKIVFVHGFSDHCNAYGSFFPNLASYGIEVFGFDQRGWGRSVKSPSQKGDAGPTSLVLSDLTSVLSTHVPSPTQIPVYLMGHSMGGAEILHYAAYGPASTTSHLRGYLAESPFVALSPASRPWPITVVLGRLAARVMPRRQMINRLDNRLVSRDEAVQRQFMEDELCHDTGTLEQLGGMLDRADALESGRVRVVEGKGGMGAGRGLWISHGTADGICSFEACKEFFETGVDVKDKEFKVYEGWFHRLHDEPGELKNAYAKDVVDWILARTAP